MAVYVYFKGGLGNQLFQYFAAKSLSKRLNKELIPDLSHFKRQKKHNGFELEKFFPDIKENKRHFCLSRILKMGCKKPARAVLNGFGQNYCLFEGKQGLNREYFLWEKPTVFMFGYWQSFRYFSNVEEEMAYLYSIENKSLSTKNLEFIDFLDKNETIGIQIRRGDYKYDHRIRSTAGLCGKEYFAKALNEVKSKNAKIVVFSDDPSWKEEDLGVPRDFVEVDWNRGGDAYLDMLLLARTNYKIISNSTFGWWGAWLGGYSGRDKGVWAPKNYIIDPSKRKIRNEDFYPPSWRLL